MKLGDNFGMVFDRRVGTVFAVKDLRDTLAALAWWGQLTPGLQTPPRNGLTACPVVYTLDLADILGHSYFLVV